MGYNATYVVLGSTQPLATVTRHVNRVILVNSKIYKDKTRALNVQRVGTKNFCKSHFVYPAFQERMKIRLVRPFVKAVQKDSTKTQQEILRV